MTEFSEKPLNSTSYRLPETTETAAPVSTSMDSFTPLTKGSTTNGLSGRADSVAQVAFKEWTPTNRSSEIVAWSVKSSTTWSHWELLRPRDADTVVCFPGVSFSSASRCLQTRRRCPRLLQWWHSASRNRHLSGVCSLFPQRTQATPWLVLLKFGTLLRAPCPTAFMGMSCIINEVTSERNWPASCTADSIA